MDRLTESKLLCARASNPSTDEVQIPKQKIVWLEASNEQLHQELLQCHEELDAFSHKASDIEADRDSLRAQLEGLWKPATPDKNAETEGVEKLKDYLARITGPEQELQTSGSDMTNHSSSTSYAGNGNISEAQPGCLDLEPDSEEKVFEHNCLQDSLDKELRELNKQLAQKEAEMKTFVKSDSVVLKQHFERKLVELEEEKQELQKERDKLECLGFENV